MIGVHSMDANAHVSAKLAIFLLKLTTSFGIAFALQLVRKKIFRFNPRRNENSNAIFFADDRTVHHQRIG